MASSRVSPAMKRRTTGLTRRELRMNRSNQGMVENLRIAERNNDIVEVGGNSTVWALKGTVRPIVLASELAAYEPSRIVAFLHPNMGDAVWHTVTLRWLREAYPSAHLVAVTGALGREILEGCGFADEVWLREGNKLALAWRMRQGRFDLGFFAYPQNKILRLAKLAGVKVLVGPKGGKVDGWLDGGTEEIGVEHAVVGFNRRLMGVLGKEVSGEETAIVIPRAAVDRVDQLPGGLPMGFVAVMAGASHKSKAWPASRFGSIVENLADLGIPSVVMGGPGDGGHGWGDMDLAGKLTVLESAEVLRRARCLVTNDTGLMHLAGAVGTPVVGIYGALTPVTHSPPGEGHRLFWKDCPCGVRNVDSCTRACLDGTTVAEVWVAVREVLGEG